MPQVEVERGSEVALARERFERELDGVRTTLDREWGWAPRGTRWIIPVVAISAGFLAGGSLRRTLLKIFR